MSRNKLALLTMFSALVSCKDETVDIAREISGSGNIDFQSIRIKISNSRSDISEESRVLLLDAICENLLITPCEHDKINEAINFYELLKWHELDQRITEFLKANKENLSQKKLFTTGGETSFYLFYMFRMKVLREQDL
jgi:hypothetical protein